MKSLPRRRARELALKVLYSLDANPDVEVGAALAAYYERFSRAEGEEEDGDGAGAAGDEDENAGDGDRIDGGFAEGMVREVSARRAEIDEILGQVSRNWRIERMARVERTILRMAVYELKYRQDVPPAVAISEAVELAKRFGAADAPAFVNGLLDSAMHALGVGPAAAR